MKQISVRLDEFAEGGSDIRQGGIRPAGIGFHSAERGMRTARGGGYPRHPPQVEHWT